MNNENKSQHDRLIDAAPADGNSPGSGAGSRHSPAITQLPGLAAIALYMVFLAGTVTLGVIRRFFPPLYLFFPVFFFAAGLGLIMLLRWAWALALAAVVLLVAIFSYQFARHHVPSLLFQGLLNFVFFLYLTRTEVRSRLK